MDKETIQAQKIVQQMMEKDAYSQWLGIELLSVLPGQVRIRMQVREEMLNGHQIAHGGVSYALADSAFAFASNGRGRKAVSIETSISHILAVNKDDILEAEAREISLGHKIGLYEVKVRNKRGALVADFKGTVYRKSEDWQV